MGSTKQVKYPPIVLVGFMGCGKSTVAAGLARTLGLKACDLDRAIVRRAGCSIPQIFGQEGEKGFRRRETAELGRLARRGRVIAAGGGVLLKAENRALLRKRGAVVVWLDPCWGELWRRLKAVPAGRRPLLMDPETARPRAERAVKKMWRQRRQVYRAGASVRVMVRSKEKVATTVRRVAERIRRSR